MLVLVKRRITPCEALHLSGATGIHNVTNQASPSQAHVVSFWHQGHVFLVRDHVGHAPREAGNVSPISLSEPGKITADGPIGGRVPSAVRVAGAQCMRHASVSPVSLGKMSAFAAQWVLTGV